MAKTIKFNLILDEYPVRNLEDMKEHFSIEDMLKYFRRGLLDRWLEVRGYDRELEAVRKVDPSWDNRVIIKELVKIFDIFIDYEDLEKGLAILDYLDEDNYLNAEYKKNGFQKKQIIDNYHEGYTKLIYHMEENWDNMAVLKADIIQMEKEYLGLFILNNKDLYYRLLRTAPKAVFAILTRDAFREYWIGGYADQQIHSNIKETLLSAPKIKAVLGKDMKIVRRNTQAMWDSIERPEIKVMVLKIEDGTFVKNAGEFSEKLSSGDINGKLVKLNGIEYQCNDESYELLYMEV